MNPKHREELQGQLRSLLKPPTPEPEQGEDSMTEQDETPIVTPPSELVKSNGSGVPPIRGY